MVLHGSETVAYAQNNCFSKENFEKYKRLKADHIKIEALSDKEKSCVFLIHSVLAKSISPNNSSECADAWDKANSAADDVVNAAKILIQCVEGSDHNDDCSSKARNVRSYHGDYESAVSEVQNYCD